MINHLLLSFHAHAPDFNGVQVRVIQAPNIPEPGFGLRVGVQIFEQELYDLRDLPVSRIITELEKQGLTATLTDSRTIEVVGRDSAQLQPVVEVFRTLFLDPFRYWQIEPCSLLPVFGGGQYQIMAEMVRDGRDWADWVASEILI